MEEKKPAKKKGSFIKSWFGFFLILIEFVIDLIRTLVIRYIAFFKKRPFTAVFVPVGLAFVAIIVVGVAAYAVFDYTMYDPKFCKVCHTLMNESYVTWEASTHGDKQGNVTCHTCHPLTPEYIVSVAGSLIHGVFKGFPDEIPERPEGEVVVRNKDCTRCHLDKVEEGLFAHHVPEEAPKVASSQFHAVHYYTEQTDCALCHGYARKRLHVFTSEPDDCLDCHDKHEDRIHATKSSDVACLNCHTDSTANLEPVNEKCLFCHGEDESARKTLAQAGTLDVRYFQPTEETISAASKIAMPGNAPMQQFACQDCHKAHAEEDADERKYDACLACHPRIENVGQHEPHMMLADCTQCHQPHSWNMTDENSCLDCHSDKEEKLHGSETEKVTCMSCHTESLEHLESGRKLCLSCHSEDEAAKAEGAMQAASKIAMPENAPMQQFACQNCHKAHAEEDAAVRKYDACLSCHPRIESVGQHEMHMMLVDEADCTQCHTPHSWSVTEEEVETTCGICHGEDITDPLTFISSGGEI